MLKEEFGCNYWMIRLLLPQWQRQARVFTTSGRNETEILDLTKSGSCSTTGRLRHDRIIETRAAMDNCALTTREATHPRRFLRHRCASLSVVGAHLPIGSLSGLVGAARSCAIQ